MSEQNPTIHLGTRASTLARWQTDHVIALLSQVHAQTHFEARIFSTKGDQILDTPLPLIGGKGLFTQELEQALLTGEIDLAVHSLKDLPTENPPGLTVGAVPSREDPLDALVCQQGHTLESLPPGAVIGTSSRRRAAQLLHHRPDLIIRDIRGNVESRIRKALDPDGPYMGTVLACAGLRRLGWIDQATQILPPAVMLPAPGQGALAVQCRDEAASLALLAPIVDGATLAAVHAERAFLAGLGGGCSVPVAAYATVTDGRITLRGRVSRVDGSAQIDVQSQGSIDEAIPLGRALAQEAIGRGAGEILGDGAL